MTRQFSSSCVLTAVRAHRLGHQPAAAVTYTSTLVARKTTHPDPLGWVSKLIFPAAGVLRAQNAYYVATRLWKGHGKVSTRSSKATISLCVPSKADLRENRLGKSYIHPPGGCAILRVTALCLKYKGS